MDGWTIVPADLQTDMQRDRQTDDSSTDWQQTDGWMFATLSRFHSNIIFSGKAGAYRNRAPYRSQLLMLAPSLPCKYETSMVVINSGKHSSLLWNGENIAYGQTSDKLNRADGWSDGRTDQGILNGEVSLYHWPPVWLVWISLFCKKIVSCHTANSKPVKQEVNGTVILPPLVFPGQTNGPADL
jgi:hypothetical protein